VGKGTQDPHANPTCGAPGREKQIPPLRGPARQKAARKRESGRSGRDDMFGYVGPTQDPGTHSVPGAPGMRELT